MTNYNDGKWHGWNGGECPVHPESDVNTFFIHDGNTPRTQTCDGARQASGQDWACVIAFRVVKEHKEPREFWVDPERCIAVGVYHAGFIHVREVQP